MFSQSRKHAARGDATRHPRRCLPPQYKLTIFATKVTGAGGTLDGNGTVSASDFNAFRLSYGTSGTSVFDFDNDGQVSAADFNQFRLRYGVMIK